MYRMYRGIEKEDTVATAWSDGGDSVGVAAVAEITRKLLINDTTVGLPLLPLVRRGRAII